MKRKLLNNVLAYSFIPLSFGIGMLTLSKYDFYGNLLAEDNPYLYNAGDGVLASSAFESPTQLSYGFTIYDNSTNDFKNNYAADSIANDYYNSTVSATFLASGVDGTFDTADDEYIDLAPGDFYLARTSSHDELYGKGTPLGYYEFVTKDGAFNGYENDGPYKIVSVSGLGLALGSETNPILDTIYITDDKSQANSETIYAPLLTEDFLDPNVIYQEIDPNSSEPIFEIDEPYLSVDGMSDNGVGTIEPVWNLEYTLYVQNGDTNFGSDLTYGFEHPAITFAQWNEADGGYWESTQYVSSHLEGHIKGTDKYHYRIEVPAHKVSPGMYSFAYINNTGIKLTGETSYSSMMQLGLMKPEDALALGIPEMQNSQTLGIPLSELTFTIPKM